MSLYDIVLLEKEKLAKVRELGVCKLELRTGTLVFFSGFHLLGIELSSIFKNRVLNQLSENFKEAISRNYMSKLAELNYEKKANFIVASQIKIKETLNLSIAILEFTSFTVKLVYGIHNIAKIAVIMLE